MASVSLFEADPELERVASPAALRELRGVAGHCVDFDEGPIEAFPPAERAGVGLLVVEGLLKRTVTVPHGSGVELIVPGDLIQPWSEEPPSFAESEWVALEPTRLALLGGPGTARLARYPELVSELARRGICRAQRQTVNAAIESVVGVDRRLLLALWHLAERVGTRSDGAVILPLPLTHELLAAMVGCRRPSVSAALVSLKERSLVERREDRAWVLRGTAPM